MHRRTLLRTAAVAGAVALPGCSLRRGSGGGYGDWFANVDNYDGTVDRTGGEEVRVLVGAEGNGGPFAFEPAAVRVDAGTRVVWEWTGRGGRHNVAEDGGRFRSQFASSEGYTYRHRLDGPGTYPYYCKPHLSLGMKGAVRVVE